MGFPSILKITPKGKKAFQKIATQKDQRLKLMLKNLSARQKYFKKQHVDLRDSGFSAELTRPSF